MPKQPRVKFYADENIDPRLIAALRRGGLSVVSATELGLSGRDDPFHFTKAKALRRFLVTSDADFLNHQQYPLRGTAGVVVLTIARTTLDLQYCYFWLVFEIAPCATEFHSTKIQVYRNHIVVYSSTPVGTVAKRTLGRRRRAIVGVDRISI